MEAGFEQAQRMGSLWMEFATRMATAGMAFRPDQPPGDAARDVRQASLSMLAEQTDKYMRSPEFLATVKQSLDASIGFRQQLNELLTQAHHSVQGVAIQDIDSVLKSVRHLEARVLDRIETVADKLVEVSRRLDALEQAAEPANRNGDHNTPAAVRTLPESETE